MADDNMKHDAAKEDEDRKQRRDKGGATNATSLISKWKSKQAKRHEAAMRPSIPQAPRWLVVGDEAAKAACRKAPFPSCRRSHLDSIGPSSYNPLDHGRGAVVLPVRGGTLYRLRPPLDASRNSAIEETQRKKKSDSDLPAVLETLVDGREKQRRHTDSYMGE
ncbi:hypothetical protein TGAM01_v210650 [Trichoderma gamsii]|uniref:Uncharacterized protein n=1 Tax=Trichoderma gamsii TaxID=398673 RepID=A0A2P4Z881_9HYPO|nr:hypothetical protein TGAM01_v210650 [Trichoderma gamsii]PON20480.1 hypothetical protein TGAM01_v210650 [Trichoderma gamsii]